MGLVGRRQFLTVSSALLAAPLVHAQQAARMYRIGFLSTSGGGGTELRGALLDALRDLGYVEGRNLEVLLRHADGKIERLPAAANELVRLAPDIIVTSINATTRAALKVTRSNPSSW